MNAKKEINSRLEIAELAEKKAYIDYYLSKARREASTGQLLDMLTVFVSLVTPLTIKALTKERD